MVVGVPERDSLGRWPLAFARQVAEDLRARLDPTCERIEIAGSIRRGRPWVGDVELLCIPRAELIRNVLGEVVGETSYLEWALLEFLDSGLLAKRRNVKGSEVYGPKNKLLTHVPTGVNLDVFTADARNWGMALLVRTGSAEFNVKVMSRFRALGGKGHAYGGVTIGEGQRPCPDEADVFRLLAWGWVDPEARA